MARRKDYDGLGMYLGEGVKDLLNREEELELIRRAQKGIRAADILKERLESSRLSQRQEVAIKAKIQQLLRPRNELMERNSRLVVSIARGYVGRSNQFELFDLANEGNFGLIRSIEKFDENMGVRFSTYASVWIRQAIQRALSSRAKTVAIPSYLANDLSEYQIMRRQPEDYLCQDVPWETEMTKEEKIAWEMNVTKKEVRLFEEISFGMVSLGTLAGAETESSSDLLADKREHSSDADCEAEALSEVFTEAFRKLTPREREVISRRFGLNGHEPQSLASVGEVLKVTRERVRQIEALALGKLQRSKIVNNHLQGSSP